jgi:hypothetical protein
MRSLRYDLEFMALMPAVLGVTGEDITAGDVWVATGTDGQIAGVLALAPDDEPGALDLNKLFVEPYFRAAARFRTLEAEATTPRVKQHLRALIDEYEKLAGKAEESPASLR